MRSKKVFSDSTQIGRPACCKASTFCIFRLRGSSWKRLVFAFPTTRIVVSLVTAICGFPPKAVTNACACFRENVSNLPVNTIFSPRNIVSPAFPLFKNCPACFEPVLFYYFIAIGSGFATSFERIFLSMNLNRVFISNGVVEW